MSLFLKCLAYLAVGLTGLACLAVAGAYYLSTRSLPDYNKTVQVSGVSAAVRIVRNTANVPHIFGQSDADVFFGLGYAHAQDRLWQMLLMRRTVQGRLSEVFGARTADIDQLIRRLDLYTLARQSVAAQDAHVLAALRAYAGGVNARIAEINRDALGRGAPEMFLFPIEVSWWQPADSIALQKLMALQLSSHIDKEVLRARVSLLLSDEARVADILGGPSGDAQTALPDYATLMPGVPRFTPSTPLPAAPLSPFRRAFVVGGSNAWAVAPTRAAGKASLLANDLPLPLAAPSAWYLARLELRSGGVIGATIPGMPQVVAGRSASLAWGVATTYADDQDVFIEQLNPNNTTEYRVAQGFAPLRSRASILHIKGEAPVTLTLRWSHNGPILPGSAYDLGAITPPGHIAALGWTALTGRDRSLSAAINLMAAQTPAQALAAMKDHVAPAFNFIVADSKTTVMKVIGALPRRAARHQTQGRMPSPGWQARNQWQGMFPYAANPIFAMPADGLVGSTNNQVVARPFPFHLSFGWGDTQRVQRWRHLMERRPIHTRESFIEAQQDIVSVSARALLPLVAAEMWFTGESAPRGTQADLRQRALALLAEWNGEMDRHLPEPLLYAAWMRALQKRLIQDELGPLAEAFTHVDALFIERVFRDVDGAALWCDVRHSTAQEACTEIARQSLDDALIWIVAQYGDKLESLRWGDAHQAAHDHAVLGAAPAFDFLANIRQSASGGDNTLMRSRTDGGEANPFLNRAGAGYRAVYDLAEPDSSLFILSTGQSGHFLSRHYDDMAPLWSRGEYVPMSLDPAFARAAAVGETLLIPQ
ncbi:MAG: penicillin acylase family protein [Rhodobacteraceae bacterium]|nr:penicillin acylase family protein [Paracoccaceae bacterium]